MIFLITGSLGAGKTSNTLWDIIYNPKFKNRPKFANYIPKFDYEKHNFEQITKEDLENWVYWTDPKDDYSTVSNFPKGSIILIDEADLFLPSSLSDKNPPRWLRELARSRHHGIDFYFITQQSKMVSPFIHGLIQSHIHYHRPDGAEMVTRYKWEYHQTNVYAKTNRMLGLPKKVLVNPEVYKLYRSTVENTRIKTPPKHIYLKMALAFFPMLLVPFFLYWFMYARHQPDIVQQPQPQKQTVVVNQQPQQQPTTKTPTPQQITEDKSALDILDTKTGLSNSDFIPPDPVLPWTAPAYRDLAKPTDFPRIAMCVVGNKTQNEQIDERFRDGSCRCFTQQYTPIDVPQNSCLRMVKEGWFDNWATGRAQSDVVLSGKSDESTARQEIAALNNQQRNNTEHNEIR